MTFFDPKIFCKQNLKKEDLAVFDCAEKIAKEALERALDSLDDYAAGMSETLDKVEREVAESFAEEYKEQLGYTLQEYVVGTIEHYEEDVEPVENPENYYYYVAGEDDEIEDDLEFLEPEDDKEE